MSTYVMSDVHGKFETYQEMLNLIDFSNQDVLYILGDVVDRGEHPIKVLQHAVYADNIHLLMGNHEQMMYDAILGKGKTKEDASCMWEWNGGYSTIAELKGLTKSEINTLLDAILKLKYYEIVEIDNKKFFLSHAGIIMQPDDTFGQALRTNIGGNKILWNRRELLVYPNTSEYVFVHGHTPSGKWTPDGEYKIYYYDNDKKINIDCGCARNKRLGCLRLDDMKEFYVDC